MRPYLLTILFVFLLSVVAFVAKSQVNRPVVDSLEQGLKRAENDTSRLFLFLQLGEQYRDKQNDTALIYYNRAYKIGEKLQHYDGMMRAINFVGIINLNAGNYNEALTNFMESLELAEKDENIFGQSISYQNMGLVHGALENEHRSRKYFVKAYDLRMEIGDTFGASNCCVGIGLSYQGALKNDSALLFYEKAIHLCDLIGDESTKNYCYTNMGHIFRDQGDYQKGLDSYLKALEIDRASNNSIGMAADLISVGQAYLDMKEYLMAEKYTLEGLKYAIETGKRDFEKNAYITLYVIYKEINNFKKALEYYEQYTEIMNELFDIEKNKQIEEMEAKYELKDHQHKIALQKAELKEQNAQLEQEKFQRIVLYSSLGILLIIGLIIYRNFRVKKKLAKVLMVQKKEINDKNEELNQQNEEIRTQRDEIEAQRDMVTQQKNEIETIYGHLSDSIEYATRIQTSILSDPSIISDYTKEHFLLYQPKDRVSGDFYWWAHVEGQTVIAVADCTGHGVPGAFMSMLGISFLREIVLKEYVTHTGVILRKLRKEVIKVLKQKEDAETNRVITVRDGMDMAIISINHEKKIMQFSGAYNPVYIVSDELNIVHSENELKPKVHNIPDSELNLYELKGDRMPIAIYDRMDKYNTQEIQLKEGDCVYLFSDGYPDQFGGNKGQKLKYKPFKDLLLSHADKPMQEQNRILLSQLNDWKGKHEQVDDISILGIKI